mgnify:FL=1|jgi:shikimate dehydrogenase
MHHYGIIGTPLGHSFSARYFAQKFAVNHIDADYLLYEVADIDLVIDTLSQHQLSGCNITIPYKERILDKLDYIDPIAKQIGAVNVVKVEHAHNHTILKGYNTDWIGFKHSISPLLTALHTQALVLGTGGAAKAIAYALEQMNIQVTFVSRDPNKGIVYDALDSLCIRKHKIIVNCTPVGMHPNENECPNIPYDSLTHQHLVYDCTYNPDETLFLRKAKQKGATTKNGLEMLYIQADEAWKIWNKI